MPAIYIFNRRTWLGGDDLQPAAYLTIVVRIVQIGLMIIPIMYHIIHYLEKQQNEQEQQQGSTVPISSTPLSLSFSLWNINNNHEKIMLIQQHRQRQLRLQNDDSNNKCQYSHPYYYWYEILLIGWITMSFVYIVSTILLESFIAYWSSIGPPIEITTSTGTVERNSNNYSHSTSTPTPTANNINININNNNNNNMITLDPTTTNAVVATASVAAAANVVASEPTTTSSPSTLPLPIPGTVGGTTGIIVASSTTIITTTTINAISNSVVTSNNNHNNNQNSNNTSSTPPISIVHKIRTPKVQNLLEYKLVPFSIGLFLIWIIGVSAMTLAPRYYQCTTTSKTDSSSTLLSLHNNNSQERISEQVSYTMDTFFIDQHRKYNDTNDNSTLTPIPSVLEYFGSTHSNTTTISSNSSSSSRSRRQIEINAKVRRTYEQQHQQQQQQHRSTTLSSSSMSLSSPYTIRKWWWWIVPAFSLLVIQIVEVMVSWMFLYQLYKYSSPPLYDEDGMLIIAPFPPRPPYNNNNNTIITTTASSSSNGSGNDNYINNYNHNDDHRNYVTTSQEYLLFRQQQQQQQQQQQERHDQFVSQNIHHQYHELIEDMWARRCAALCQCLSISTCFMFGGRSLVSSAVTTSTTNPISEQIGSGAFGDVARALADYLETGGVLDVVPSDIITGLIVLQRLQRRRIYQARRDVLSQRENSMIMKLDIQQQLSSVHNKTADIPKVAEFRALESPHHHLQQKQDQLHSNHLHHHHHHGGLNDDGEPILLRKNSPGGLYRRSRSVDVTSDKLQTTPVEDVLLPMDNIPNLSGKNSSDSCIEDVPNSPSKNMRGNIGYIMDNMYDDNNNSNKRQHTSIYRMDFEHDCYERSSRSVLNRDNVVDRSVLEEGARYARYALAIYTWVLYLYVYPMTGPYRLLSRTFKTKSWCSGCYCCCWGAGILPPDVDVEDDDPNNEDDVREDIPGYRFGSRTRRQRQRRRQQQQHQQQQHMQRQDIDVEWNTTTQRDHTASTSVVGAGLSSECPLSDQHQHSSQHYYHNPARCGGRITGDNLCETHKNAILLTAGIEDDSDLVYVQLKSSFSDNPYCILLDHEWKSVVVSIRGTFSLEDCVTDVLIDPEPLEQFGFDHGFADVASGGTEFCHGGVLLCVKNVYRDLERHKILDDLLYGDHAMYPDYTLRLVGHSLGAAACSLLSYMLRSKFPTLRCCNYSPPGCTFTWKMATNCHDWCTSFVLDSDLVPRLSFHSMERLRDEVLELIARTKVPKIEVTSRFVFSSLFTGSTFCTCVNNDHDSDKKREETLIDKLSDILYDVDEIPDSSYKKQLERFRAIQQERKISRGVAFRSIPLFPPGRIVHIVKTKENRSCLSRVVKAATCNTSNIGFEYIPVYINNDDLNEIVVTATMGTDHFPNRMNFILQKVASEFGLRPNRTHRL